MRFCYKENNIRLLALDVKKDSVENSIISSNFVLKFLNSHKKLKSVVIANRSDSYTIVNDQGVKEAFENMTLYLPLIIFCDDFYHRIRVSSLHLTSIIPPNFFKKYLTFGPFEKKNINQIYNPADFCFFGIMVLLVFLVLFLIKIILF